MSERKPILCLDFDGVIHSYESGWKGADKVPDRPVPGAMEFLADAVQHFRVAIFSSRSNQPGGHEAMRAWLERNAMELLPGNFSWIHQIEWPLEKPPALVTIDDRALTFDGTWPSIETIKSFKPWNKR